MLVLESVQILLFLTAFLFNNKRTKNDISIDGALLFFDVNELTGCLSLSHEVNQ